MNAAWSDVFHGARSCQREMAPFNSRECFQKRRFVTAHYADRFCVKSRAAGWWHGLFPSAIARELAAVSPAVPLLSFRIADGRIIGAVHRSHHRRPREPHPGDLELGAVLKAFRGSLPSRLFLYIRR